MAIVFALIAFVGWGVGTVFGGLASKKIGSYSSVFWSFLFSIILTSFYIPFSIGELRSITPQTIAWLFVLILIGIIPVISLYEGFRVGNASLVGTIGSAFSALVVILSIVFLGNKINLSQSFSVIIIILGLFLATLNFNNYNLKKLITDKGAPYGLVAMIFWGIYFTFVAIPTKEIGWFWPAYTSYFGIVLIYIFTKVKKIQLVFPKDRNTKLFIILNAVCIGAALFSYNLAISIGQAAVVAPIAGAYPVLFASIAYFVFKDRLNRQQIIGIVTTLIGIISLSVF